MTLNPVPKEGLKTKGHFGTNFGTKAPLQGVFRS